ncbi:hypothetical protein PanWU01x14_091210 [Parasponia andersonii]|uniref:Uncharacterized protein n=1 Tax=Parasponia andersonii TaxID=3476 RepID=A0A2P5D766_PARAD|nr:hypothetical protein PanWU01x14_091210 [Parasponia andersonii]
MGAGATHLFSAAREEETGFTDDDKRASWKLWASAFRYIPRIRDFVFKNQKILRAQQITPDNVTKDRTSRVKTLYNKNTKTSELEPMEPQKTVPNRPTNPNLTRQLTSP